MRGAAAQVQLLREQLAEARTEKKTYVQERLELERQLKELKQRIEDVGCCPRIEDASTPAWDDYPGMVEADELFSEIAKDDGTLSKEEMVAAQKGPPPALVPPLLTFTLIPRRLWDFHRHGLGQ